MILGDQGEVSELSKDVVSVHLDKFDILFFLPFLSY